ncbi:MAG: rRNA maturation RNase YbeY [Ignavibacteria bacterium]|nr:rRNA maturation RNase YbeY [Ignavibacteria bacterium]
MIQNLSLFTEKGIKINKKSVHDVVSRIIKSLDLEIFSLDINFVTEETITEINKRYLNHNYATDIISFNYSFESNNLDGEILICNAVALSNAARFNTTYEQELRRLIIHGILHLIGYDDSTDAQRKLMRAKENKILLKLNGIGRITIQ